jgi:hypothetical protein
VNETGTLDNLLAVHERRLEGRADIVWGARRRWTTRTRGGTRRYSDNATGFLNYREPYGVQEIEWADQRWLVSVEGELRRKRYDQQTVGRGVEDTLPAVYKREVIATLRVERKLSTRWTLYTELQFDEARSNDEIASYRTKEGLLGVRWSWEK